MIKLTSTQCSTVVGKFRSEFAQANSKLARNGRSVVLVITKGGPSKIKGWLNVDGGGSVKHLMVILSRKLMRGMLCIRKTVCDMKVSRPQQLVTAAKHT